MLRVYPASKVKHAQKWLDLHESNPHLFFHARWLKASKKESDFNNGAFGHLWRMCEEDVKSADVVLVYAEEGDRLKGAFVEAGMALAFDKKVLAVGCEGTWVHHKNVKRCETLKQALAHIKLCTPQGALDAILAGHTYDEVMAARK